MAALPGLCEISCRMAAFLALLSAVWFALAAALQQRGQFALARGGKAGRGRRGPVPAARGAGLAARDRWSCSLGYATQGAALDRGKLVVVQPLMVTTIVWALPLGHWLTRQQVVRARCSGPASSWSGSRCSCWSATPTPASTARTTQRPRHRDGDHQRARRGCCCCGCARSRRRRCAPRSSASARACSSGCRPASPSRSSTTCTSASARPPEPGGPGRCSGSASSRSSSSSCRWRPASSRRRWPRSRSRTPRSA